MALCLVMMVPYGEIDVSASFAAAFVTVRPLALSPFLSLALARARRPLALGSP